MIVCVDNMQAALPVPLPVRPEADYGSSLEHHAVPVADY